MNTEQGLNTNTEPQNAHFTDTRLGIFYFLGVVFGVFGGVLQILVGDPLFTALAVLVFTMILGVSRPLRPWRWVLSVGIPIPLTMFVAQLFDPRLHYTRATIAGTVLIVLPGFAGAYGGYFMRKMIKDIYFADK